MRQPRAVSNRVNPYPFIVIPTRRTLRFLQSVTVKGGRQPSNRSCRMRTSAAALSLGTILLVLAILLLLGALPTWRHSRSWGYAPSGGLGLIRRLLRPCVCWVALAQSVRCSLPHADTNYRLSLTPPYAKRFLGGWKPPLLGLGGWKPPLLEGFFRFWLFHWRVTPKLRAPCP